ncbi:hypothetical protein ACA910_006529 [Epithemia clementina (nom. ined.)]
MGVFTKVLLRASMKGIKLHNDVNDTKTNQRQKPTRRSLTRTTTTEHSLSLESGRRASRCSSNGSCERSVVSMDSSSSAATAEYPLSHFSTTAGFQFTEVPREKVPGGDHRAGLTRYSVRREVLSCT